MAFLEKIKSPRDVKAVPKEYLSKLAKEIRERIVYTVAKTGGHLASSLGVVELTIALHYCFCPGEDKIIWDVGHQTYAHKILTGRNEEFDTLRQYKGISGFPKMAESGYDSFGAGHASTSISAALGYAVAGDLLDKDYKVIAVIGDGSMTGGLAFEGLQNAGTLSKNMIVILNDNQMFISEKVGVLSGYLAKILTAGSIKRIEERVKKVASRIRFWGFNSIKILNRFKAMLFPGMLFEEMGFRYIGPIDGHNINQMIDIFSNVKQFNGPILLHVVTKKGKGYKYSESDPTKFHGISPFDVKTGKINSLKKVTYTEVFSKAIVKLARENDKIVAVTAAMPDGTGLKAFAKEFPDRFFDVGIAEGHAVTFAAGLAAAGVKPVVAVYSTFMQRALDNIIHDVALQNLPVVMVLDRAGIVGEDGATHHGAFDLSYLKYIPNLTIMAPANETELQDMLKTAFTINGPVVIRYPRGSGTRTASFHRDFEIIDVGKAKIEREGKDVCIAAIGNTVNACLEAADMLEAKGIKVSVLNMRFLKPFDDNIIKDIAVNIKKFVTVEENSLLGGMGETIKSVLSGKDVQVRSLGISDFFIEHGSQSIIRNLCGLSAQKIFEHTIKLVSE